MTDFPNHLFYDLSIKYTVIHFYHGSHTKKRCDSFYDSQRFLVRASQILTSQKPSSIT